MLINLNLDIKISIWCKKLEEHKLKSESQTKQGFLCSKQGDIRIFSVQNYKNTSPMYYIKKEENYKLVKA